MCRSRKGIGSSIGSIGAGDESFELLRNRRAWKTREIHLCLLLMMEKAMAQTTRKKLGITIMMGRTAFSCSVLLVGGVAGSEMATGFIDGLVVQESKLL